MALIGLLNERAAAADQLAAIEREASTQDNSWSIAMLEARMQILEGSRYEVG